MMYVWNLTLIRLNCRSDATNNDIWPINEGNYPQIGSTAAVGRIVQTLRL
jgi:hypothetical protein